MLSGWFFKEPLKNKVCPLRLPGQADGCRGQRQAGLETKEKIELDRTSYVLGIEELL